MFSLDHVIMYFKDALVVISEYPVHARSELFHHLNVVEKPHNFTVAREAHTGREEFYSHPTRSVLFYQIIKLTHCLCPPWTL